MIFSVFHKFSIFPSGKLKNWPQKNLPPPMNFSVFFLGPKSPELLQLCPSRATNPPSSCEWGHRWHTWLPPKGRLKQVTSGQLDHFPAPLLARVTNLNSPGSQIRRAGHRTAWGCSWTGKGSDSPAGASWQAHTGASGCLGEMRFVLHFATGNTARRR